MEYQDYENEDQEYADVVSDNSIASWAELDLSLINLEVPSLGPDFDIDLLGIKNFEIEPADKYGDKDADEVPESRKTDIKLSQMFQLGNHRLLCGDATDPCAVELLMIGEKADMVYTDPPYGMNLNTNYARSNRVVGKSYRPVEGDDEDYDPRPFFDLFDYVEEQFWWGADYHCEHIPKGGAWVVWIKNKQNLMKASELALSFVGLNNRIKMIARFLWSGFTAKERNETRVHPTQKPIGLVEWLFERWGKDKTNIVDLYGGSGSTLIACRKTNRKCFMMEIDPSYCQVIINRWEKFTGLKAVKVT